MKTKTEPDVRSAEIEMVVSKIPESFTVDHRNMTAPQVRKAGVLTGPAGDKVSKFDLRFLKPNHDSMPTGAIHTLEHLLALYMRRQLKGIIDLSPMGCRTGFYFLLFEEKTEEEVRAALVDSLREVLRAKWEDVPGVDERSCGNYRDHSLRGAQEYAKMFLEGFEK